VHKRYFDTFSEETVRRPSYRAGVRRCVYYGSFI
jgi:hypothetical protein